MTGRTAGCNDSKALAEVFAKHFGASETPPDIDYTREMTGKKSPAVLTEYKALLQDIRAGPAPNGSLNKLATQIAMQTLCIKNEKKWHLADTQKETANAAADSIRAMCRHVQLTLAKAQNGQVIPAWCQPFMPAGDEEKGEDAGDEEEGEEESPTAPTEPVSDDEDGEELEADEEEELKEDEEEEEDGEADGTPIVKGKPAAKVSTPLKSAAATVDYDVGYNADMQAAWRRPMHLKSKPIEYNKRMFAPEGAKDTDDAWAEWPDGMTRKICALTCGELASRKDTQQMTHFSGRMVDGNRVDVRSTKTKEGVVERYMLLKTDKQTGDKRQLCQISIVSEASLNWMINLAERHCIENYNKLAMDQEKREFLKTQKTQGKKQGSVMRRPAAATAAVKTKPGKKKEAKKAKKEAKKAKEAKEAKKQKEAKEAEEAKEAKVAKKPAKKEKTVQQREKAGTPKRVRTAKRDMPEPIPLGLFQF